MYSTAQSSRQEPTSPRDRFAKLRQAAKTSTIAASVAEVVVNTKPGPSAKLGQLAKFKPVESEYRLRQSASAGGIAHTVSTIIKPGFALPGEFKGRGYQATLIKTDAKLTKVMRCCIDGDHIIVHFPEPVMKKLNTSLKPKLEPGSWRVELKDKRWQRPVTVTSHTPRVAFKLAGVAEKAVSVRGCTVAASGAWSLWTDWVKLDPAAEATLALPGE